MKNTRKILILLLMVAMSFACMSVFAYAAEATPTADQLAYEAALANHKKVLEYYEAGYYLNADFDDDADFDAALSEKREVPEKTWATNGHGGKRKKNIANSLFIDPEALEKSVLARQERYNKIEENEVLYEELMTEDADIVIVAYGITSRICKSAIEKARAEGIKVGLIRPITLWPYPKAALAKAADTAKHFLVVELNMGQMVDDVKVATECRRPVSFFGRTGGMLPTADDVLAEIRKINGGIN